MSTIQDVVLEAIQAGHRDLDTICSATALKRRSVQYAIERLLEAKLIRSNSGYRAVSCECLLAAVWRGLPDSLFPAGSLEDDQGRNIPSPEGLTPSPADPSPAGALT
jgi:hypothetical protein